MVRLSIVLGLIVTAVSAPIGAEVVRESPLAALGLDNRQSIEWNLAVLSDPREMIEGMWGGGIGAFDVRMSGNDLATPPDVIDISIPSIYSQQAVEKTFGLDASDAHVAACPAELLMDDGIGCSAVFYGCDETTKRCRVLVTTYERDDLPDYPPFPGYTSVTWSLEGVELPAP